MPYRLIVPLAAVLSLSPILADDTPLEWSAWFTQDFSGLTTGASWTDSAGTWTKDANDATTLEDGPDGKYLQLNTRDADLQFTAVRQSASLKPVSFDMQMTFFACQDGEEYLRAPTDSYAAVVLRQTMAGAVTNFVFLGWTAQNWIALASPHVQPEEDRLYALHIDLDLSIKPNRVRYSIDGHVLRDAEGHDWFDANTSFRGNAAYSANDLSQDHVRHVVFSGGGKVGRFSGQEATQKTPRARIAFDAPSDGRISSGSELTFTVAPDAGQALGTLRYVWRRVDSIFSRADETLGTTGDSHTVTEADYGHWILVEAYDENGYVASGSNYVSRLPVLYIDTDDGQMPTAAKEEHTATMRTVAGETPYLADQLYTGPISVKVRGNSTKSLPKKPYKIKLDAKTNMFGLDPENRGNKHWVLLANYYDESMMRNKTAYDLSGVLGVPTYMKSTWVDVIFNGQFLGCYQFCQHIRLGKDRVNVYDWEDAGETVAGKLYDAYPDLAGATSKADLESYMASNFTWVTSAQLDWNGATYPITTKIWKKYTDDISGGYLFELSHEYDEPSKFTVTNGVQASFYKIMLNKPEFLFTNPDMMDYCRAFWLELSDAWTSGTGYSATGAHYTDLADLDSMVGYWLTMFIMGNSDSAAKSRYAYKDQGGKLVFGPVWDFDWGCGSPQVRRWTTNEVGHVSLQLPSATGWVPGARAENFMREWSGDPFFCMKLREAYLAARPYLANLLADGGLYDQRVAYIRESGIANETRWRYRAGFSGATGDAAVFRQYLKDRIAWLDAQFATLETFVASIGPNARNHPYRAATALLAPTFPDLPDAPGSDTLKLASSAQPFTVRVAVADARAASLDVYVNSRLVANRPVQDGICTAEIPGDSLTSADDAENIVAFLARTATGAFLTNTVSGQSVSTRNFVRLVKGGTRTISLELNGGTGADSVSAPYGAALSAPDDIAKPDFTFAGWFADEALTVPYAFTTMPLTNFTIYAKWMRSATATHHTPYSFLDMVWEKLQTNAVPPATEAEYESFADSASPFGKSVPLWQDFVAGTDPEKTNDIFTASISFTNGQVVISWSPNLNTNGIVRTYTILGKTNLVDQAWHSPTNEASRFFKVNVSLP